MTSLCGWYGVVRVIFIPRMVTISLKISLSKFLPWSVCSHCLAPYLHTHSSTNFLGDRMCLLISDCVCLGPSCEVIDCYQYETITTCSVRKCSLTTSMATRSIEYPECSSTNAPRTGDSAPHFWQFLQCASTSDLQPLQ